MQGLERHTQCWGPWGLKSGRWLCESREMREKPPSIFSASYSTLFKGASLRRWSKTMEKILSLSANPRSFCRDPPFKFCKSALHHHHLLNRIIRLYMLQHRELLLRTSVTLGIKLYWVKARGSYHSILRRQSSKRSTRLLLSTC